MKRSAASLSDVADGDANPWVDTRTVRGLWLSGLHGVIFGGCVGGISGGVLGTVVPIIGNIIGGMIGALLGACAGLPAGILGAGFGSRQGWRVGGSLSVLTVSLTLLAIVGWHDGVSPEILEVFGVITALFLGVGFGLGEMAWVQITKSVPGSGFYGSWRQVLHQYALDDMSDPRRTRSILAALGLVPLAYGIVYGAVSGYLSLWK